ncbi:DNA-binding protein [Methylobacterium sp. 22177]|uniref:DNA-binding protein n=1 Tax=Methylobacterium sp. 22177 TaxID=3453885 RepID=UPI003F82E396
MPTREQVDWAARKVLADGGRVSLRTVIAALKAGPARGGSFRDVGPLLRDWKAERAYRPRLVPAGLPERLQAVLGKAAAEMWEAAGAEAAAALLVERDKLAARARAGDELLEEALARLDVAEAEAARLRERVEGLEERQEKVRAEEFWDRVMREVFEILPTDGAMSAAEILPLLKRATVRGAAGHREPLTKRTLRKKMAGRAEQGWYFVAGMDGAFSRGTFPTMGRSKRPALAEADPA